MTIYRVVAQDHRNAAGIALARLRICGRPASKPTRPDDVFVMRMP
jgi:hypothetical protein